MLITQLTNDPMVSVTVVTKVFSIPVVILNLVTKVTSVSMARVNVITKFTGFPTVSFIRCVHMVNVTLVTRIGAYV